MAFTSSSSSKTLEFFRVHGRVSSRSNFFSDGFVINEFTNAHFKNVHKNLIEKTINYHYFAKKGRK